MASDSQTRLFCPKQTLLIMPTVRFQATPSSQRKDNSECSKSCMLLFSGEVWRQVLSEQKTISSRYLTKLRWLHPSSPPHPPAPQSLPLLMSNFGHPKTSHREVRSKETRKNKQLRGTVTAVSSYFTVNDAHAFSMKYVIQSDSVCKEKALQALDKQKHFSSLLPSLCLFLLS